jgi:expansin (peptidoglycan-binding protein)
MGSCNGNYIDDSMPVVAVNAAQYNHGLCYATVEVFDSSTGITAQFSVQDRCASCPYGALDLTPAAWRRLGRDTYTSGIGRIRWRFV